MASSQEFARQRRAGLLLFLGEALGGTTDWFDLALVEVTNLGTVVEQHAVALPIETVCEDDFAFGAHRHAVDFGRRANPVAHLQYELVRVRRGEAMWLPELHYCPFCPLASESREFTLEIDTAPFR